MVGVVEYLQTHLTYTTHASTSEEKYTNFCHATFFLYSQFNKSMFVTCILLFFFSLYPSNRVQVLWCVSLSLFLCVCVCIYVGIHAFYSSEYHIPPHVQVHESLCIVDDAAYICACVKIKISAVIVPASTNNICVMCECALVLLLLFLAPK